MGVFGMEVRCEIWGMWKTCEVEKMISLGLLSTTVAEMWRRKSCY